MQANTTFIYHKFTHVTVNLTATASYPLATGGPAIDGPQSYDIHFYWKDLLWPEVKALGRLIKDEKAVTEYHLPLVVALLPLVYVLFEWGGGTWTKLMR